jgi:hypothetical protein
LAISLAHPRGEEGGILFCLNYFYLPLLGLERGGQHPVAKSLPQSPQREERLKRGMEVAIMIFFRERGSNYDFFIPDGGWEARAKSLKNPSLIFTISPLLLALTVFSCK